MKNNKIVVCGATGNQGSAVVHSLLKAGIKVVALTRDPESKAAQKLVAAGADVMKADMMDAASLTEAFANARGVFGVTQPWSRDYKKCNVQAELKQGKNIVDACGAASVPQLVMSSVINFENRASGVPHLDSKMHIEQYLKAQPLAYTIIRCAQFMDNVGTHFFPVKKGMVKGFIHVDAKVPYVACRDIGELATRAFLQPDKYLYKTVDLVGDFISGRELAAALGGLRNGEAFTYKAVPSFILRLFAPEFYTMRRMFERTGYPPYSAEITDALKQSDNLLGGATSMAAHLKLAGYSNRVLS